MSLGRKVGAKLCSTQAVNKLPLIGPSNTQGATTAPWRRPATKVSVRQRPCGTEAVSGVPRAHQLRVRVLSVCTQVSSTKTKRLGSTRC